ncbi:MAG: type VI secretion system-associated protein TagF [Candidatus Competibacteraceae bacterium]|nr:type VI secretion system-associated protein TagF [Candidatus Competibacteraceae bacterium]
MSPKALDGPGLHGKLPARGDFLTRHLPRDFVTPWDLWLQQSLAASRRMLGQDWLARYLVSPLWRFALLPGVCGPQAVCGVLMPSVDRVGRYFPLTLAVALAQRPAPQVLLNQDWFPQAEALLLEALGDLADLEHWVARINALGAPGVGASPPPSEPPLPDLCYHDLPIGQACPSLAAAPGLWWTTGSEAISPCLLTTRSLPGGEPFTALLDGHWQDHGWHRQDPPPTGALQEG